MPQDRSMPFRGPGGETHVFLDVLERRWDPFAGLIEVLKRRPETGAIHRITPSASEQDLIRRTEYSGGRSTRLWRYRSLLPSVRERVVRVLNSASPGAAVLYTADEGVWGELARSIRGQFRGRVRTINVQHGVLLAERARYLRARKTINRVTEGVFGFPVIGSGFGGSAFDTYLVYSDTERDFLRAGGRQAEVLPRLIKRDMILTSRENQGAANRALFALPACVPGSEIRCTLEDFIRNIGPLVVETARRTGKPALLRPHPGRGGAIARRMVEELDLSDSVEFDESADGAHVSGAAGWVFSAHSTVLFEAALLGLVPIAIRSSCFDTPLPFENEVVDVRRPLSDQLDRAMGEEARQRFSDAASDEWTFDAEVNRIFDGWSKAAATPGTR